MESVLNFAPIHRKLGGILLLLFAIFSGSCVDQEVRLTREQLNSVDSLFLEERKIWLTKLEDSCATLRDAHFQVWVDSMKQNRLRDIEKMLGR